MITIRQFKAVVRNEVHTISTFKILQTTRCYYPQSSKRVAVPCWITPLTQSLIKAVMKSALSLSINVVLVNMKTCRRRNHEEQEFL